MITKTELLELYNAWAANAIQCFDKEGIKQAYGPDTWLGMESLLEAIQDIDKCSQTTYDAFCEVLDTYGDSSNAGEWYATIEFDGCGLLPYEVAELYDEMDEYTCAQVDGAEFEEYLIDRFCEIYAIPEEAQFYLDEALIRQDLAMDFTSVDIGKTRFYLEG